MGLALHALQPERLSAGLESPGGGQTGRAREAESERGLAAQTVWRAQASAEANCLGRGGQRGLLVLELANAHPWGLLQG